MCPLAVPGRLMAPESSVGRFRAATSRCPAGRAVPARSVEHLLSREPAHPCAQITMNSIIESVISQYIVAVLVAVTLAALAAARARWARKGKSRALPPLAGGEPPCRPAGHETHHVRRTRRTHQAIESSHGRRKESSS